MWSGCCLCYCSLINGHYWAEATQQGMAYSYSLH